MRRLLALAVFAWLALLASTARAGLTLALSPVSLSTAPGAERVFSGTLLNTSTTDKLYLNDVQAVFTGASSTSLVLKPNTFFANVPGILLPGESYSGPLFSVKLLTGAAAANYDGSITLVGGATLSAIDSLGTASITVLATPVEQWRYQTFGDAANTAAASDSADWDQDGVTNVLEYALGLNATTSDANALPQPVLLAGHPSLSFVPVASDVTYTVESSTDLVLWSGANVEQVTLVNPMPPNLLTFRYTLPLEATAPVFLRIKVTRP